MMLPLMVKWIILASSSGHDCYEISRSLLQYRRKTWLDSRWISAHTSLRLVTRAILILDAMAASKRVTQSAAPALLKTGLFDALGSRVPARRTETCEVGQVEGVSHQLQEEIFVVTIG